MNNLKTNIEDKYNLKILFILISSFLIDYIWINLYDIIPAWDQGYHLSNLYKFSNLLQQANIFDNDWINSFWTITSSYRGPLTYIISAIFINLFGITLKNAILSNFIFNTLVILSIYEISRKYCKKETGFWAICIYTFNPFIFNLRNDYLIDIAQTSLIMLNWLFLCKWFFNKEPNYKSVCLSGILLGLLFLTKPTAIVFFIFPLFIIFTKKLYYYKFYFEFFIYPLSFLILIYPWFSRNWLTIITSTINSFSWGIKYQEGLEVNTIEGWLYYPFEIIKILNPILISALIFIFLINIYKGNINYINITRFNNLRNIIPKNFIWWISFPLNIFLVNVLMSSKDPRFILPIIPILCIFIGKIIVSFKNKYYISRISKKFIVLIIIILLLNNQIKIYNLKFNGKELFELEANNIHKQIINAVNKESPFSQNVVGFIPDTKEFNAFNLDAEAIRDNKGVRVSQIISNERQFKDELKRYDWFIIKTGDQGVMTNKAKIKLSELLLESNSFKIFKQWDLIDNSNLILIKRKNLSHQIKLVSCAENNNPIKLKSLPRGFQLIIKEKVKNLDNKNILINFKRDNANNALYLSLPPIKNIEDTNKCILIDNKLGSEINIENNQTFLDSNALIFNETHSYKRDLEYSKYRPNQNDQIILKMNKIENVKLMGRYLQFGEFDKLFEIAGLLNQSDPDQNYLKNAEIIFKKKLSLNPSEIDELYSLLISQILQKEAKDAINTIEEIALIDSSNANLYLVKTIVDTYLFDLKSAQLSIKKAKSINQNNQNEEIINTADSILKLFSYKFLEGFKELY